MPEKRTYADRAEYLKKAVSERRKKLREMALEYGGGKCILCGYSVSKRAMIFHHVDASQKDFGLSARGLTRSWEKMRAELEKCVLLCANCHGEVHDNITQLPEGILAEKRGEFGETLAPSLAKAKKQQIARNGKGNPEPSHLTASDASRMRRMEGVETIP